MEYLAYEDIDDQPCLVVDGKPHPSAAITLSHWPNSGTPLALKEDLSTQIVIRYLRSPGFHVDVPFATNDHFDEDGLASLYAVLYPREALERSKALCDFASAGDFGTFQHREAARSAFVVSAFADPERSPFGEVLLDCPDPAQVAHLYRELIGRLPEIIDHPERYERYWREEDEVLRASEEALRRGAIGLEEHPHLDLAIVRLPENATPRRVHRYAQAREVDCHPMAIYNAADCLRILYVKGRHYELEYRYESWVEYVSRRPVPRVDLRGLATDLSAREGAGVVWAFDGVGHINPHLSITGADESNIDEPTFCELLETTLATAPPAWNPYSETS